MEKESKSVKKTACDVEALKKCLEENKGDYLKCQSHVEAFRSSCSINNTNSSSPNLKSENSIKRRSGRQLDTCRSPKSESPLVSIKFLKDECIGSNDINIWIKNEKHTKVTQSPDGHGLVCYFSSLTAKS